MKKKISEGNYLDHIIFKQKYLENTIKTIFSIPLTLWNETGVEMVIENRLPRKLFFPFCLHCIYLILNLMSQSPWHLGIGQISSDDSAVSGPSPILTHDLHFVFQLNPICTS